MAYSKKSQAEYNKKRKQFKVQYSLSDNNEGLRLQKYLDDNGLTANTYIKDLIKRDLDNKKIPYNLRATNDD